MSSSSSARNLDLPADALYDELYCQRGEAENRIKEAQLDLFGTRASCHKFHANWLRLMFAALAYTLMQRLRTIALAGTELAQATASTIRLRLLKIGATVIRNTRRVRIMLASHHQWAAPSSPPRRRSLHSPYLSAAPTR
ncbi:MAG: transposase [Rhodocyclaceae bacterium]|nr:transposase [Rhodocyclaceae bacterium]